MGRRRLHVVFAGLLLLAGTLGDRWGRRRALTIGLAVFASRSAAAAFSGGVGQLSRPGRSWARRRRSSCRPR